MVALIALALLSAGNSVPAAAAGEPVKDKVICKKDRTADTGTRLSAPKICKKASEWKRGEDETRRTIERAQDHHGSAR